MSSDEKINLEILSFPLKALDVVAIYYKTLTLQKFYKKTEI